MWVGRTCLYKRDVEQYIRTCNTIRNNIMGSTNENETRIFNESVGRGRDSEGEREIERKRNRERERERNRERERERERESESV